MNNLNDRPNKNVPGNYVFIKRENWSSINKNTKIIYLWNGFNYNHPNNCYLDAFFNNFDLDNQVMYYKKVIRVSNDSIDLIKLSELELNKEYIKDILEIWIDTREYIPFSKK